MARALRCKLAELMGTAAAVDASGVLPYALYRYLPLPTVTYRYIPLQVLPYALELKRSGRSRKGMAAALRDFLGDGAKGFARWLSGLTPGGQASQLPTARPPPQQPCSWDAAAARLRFIPGVRGAIFGATSATFDECLARGLFGAPAGRSDAVRRISAERDRTLLFLFNFDSREMHGVFTPTAPAGFPLEAEAWAREPKPPGRGEASGATSSRKAWEGRRAARRGSQTPYPAQIPVRRIGPPLPPLRECAYRPVMRYDSSSSHKFKLELDADQTARLANLFVQNSSATSGVRIGTDEWG